MLTSTMFDKENIQGEILATTPGRKPLKTVRMIAQNAVIEGTPPGFVKKTPRQKLSSLTPSSMKHSRRKSKRRSVPLRLSKVYSVFDEETVTQTTSTSAGLTDRLSIFEDDSLTGWKQGQALNEMLREKVFETVNKMRERYESCIAEKERHLIEQGGIIAKLKTEVNVLKQDQKGFLQVTNMYNKTTEESENLCDDEQVSLFVEQILLKAAKDIQSDPSLPSSCSGRTNSVAVLATKVSPAGSKTLSPAKQIDSYTSMTPITYANSETSMTAINICSEPTKHINSGTMMTPLRKTDSETTMTPVQQMDSETSITPVRQTNSETSITPTIQADSATSVTPVELVEQDTMMSPVQTYHAAIITSPLVAALHPEIINGLPFESLRSELESAAISNELLRTECDELNCKVEDLELLLKDLRSSAGKDSRALQEQIDCLQKQLEEALEINYQMELKKPYSVEEYEDSMKRLNKDLLLKEKQIAFYAKKASEADNLQKDLRRMYAKYNAEHQSYTALDKKMNNLVEEHNIKCREFEAMKTQLSDLRVELGEAKATVDAQDKIREEAKKNQVKCCSLEEQIVAFQSQEKENMEFMEQERKGLEETTLELEHLVKERTTELNATRQALEMKTEQYEDLRETMQGLRSQLAEVQDELNSVQSQAYLVMLEQEKELTAVSRVLEEAWDRLTTMVKTIKEESKLPADEKISEVGEEKIKSSDRCGSYSALQDYKPSLVCSVLEAVSSAVTPTKASESPDEEEEERELKAKPVGDNSPRNARHDSRDLTLVDRAVSISELLNEIEEHTRGKAAKDKAQIQEYQDKIASLENVLEETTHKYGKTISILKQDLELGKGSLKELQRENSNKQQEIENLKVELLVTERNFQASEDRVGKLSDRYCQLIEQETETEGLKENVRILRRETMGRLRATVERMEETDLVTRETTIQESFTELLREKFKLQSELRDNFAKSQMEKESFTQYRAKLETKANDLASNLMKAEEEIYRLDGIIDRFCLVAQQNQEMTVQCKDLCDLLNELNITIK